MATVLLRRAMITVPLLVLLTVGAFSLQLLLPGDPASALAGIDATPEQIEAARQTLRLDDPAPVRYTRWVGDVVSGDFGQSLKTRLPVSDELARRLPVTFTLAGLALGVAFLIGIPLGMLQGVTRGRLPDRVASGIVSVMVSVPNFWVATMLVSYFAVRRGWVPSGGYASLSEGFGTWLEHLVLPVITLALFITGETARQIRAGLVTVLEKDYVRAARARGLSNTRVIGRHALRNAAMPALTIIGIRVGHLLAGSLIIEQIFRIPGIGTYTLTAIQNRDFPVIQGVVLTSGLIVVTVSFLIDIAYAALNPKVRVA